MISALQFALSYSSLLVQAFLLQSYFFWRCRLLAPRGNRLASSLYPCFVKFVDIFHIDCKCLCKNNDSVCIWQLMVMINCWLTESFFHVLTYHIFRNIVAFQLLKIWRCTLSLFSCKLISNDNIDNDKSYQVSHPKPFCRNIEYVCYSSYVPFI